MDESYDLVRLNRRLVLKHVSRGDVCGVFRRASRGTQEVKNVTENIKNNILISQKNVTKKHKRGTKLFKKYKKHIKYSKKQKTQKT